MQTNVLLWHIVCVGTRPFELLGDGMDQRRDARVVDVSWGVVLGVVRCQG